MPPGLCGGTNRQRAERGQDRIYRCFDCGYFADQDVNAARNILKTTLEALDKSTNETCADPVVAVGVPHVSTQAGGTTPASTRDCSFPE